MSHLSAEFLSDPSPWQPGGDWVELAWQAIQQQDGRTRTLCEELEAIAAESEGVTPEPEPEPEPEQCAEDCFCPEVCGGADLCCVCSVDGMFHGACGLSLRARAILETSFNKGK